MKTDDLIRSLAADTAAPRPMGVLLAAGLLPALACGVLGLWLAYGFRPDLVASVFRPVSVMRFVLALSLAVVAMRLALLLARPEGADLARYWPLGAVAAVALGLLGGSWLATPAEAVQMAVVGKTMVWCLATIPVLAILPVAAILAALRQGASVVPRLSAALAGLAGGGLGAAIYALHCTEDSPLFFVTWYGLAIAGVTVATTLFAPRLLRW